MHIDIHVYTHVHTLTGSQACIDTHIHMYPHTHTLSVSHSPRRGSAHCSVRPATVLCWLVLVLVQHVLLMTLIQARFLHCVWAVALSYKALWHVIPGRGRVKLHMHSFYYGTAWLSFSVHSTFLIIDDTETCQAAWACVVLTLALLFRVRNDHQTPDRSVKCLSGRKVHSSGMLLFLESWQETACLYSIQNFNQSLETVVI